MKRLEFCLMLIGTLVFTCVAVAQDGAELLRQSGVQGGVVVHLGCGDGALTIELTKGKSFVICGLNTDAGAVAAARKRLPGCWVLR